MEISLSNFVFSKLPLKENIFSVRKLGFKKFEFNPECIKYEADESIPRLKQLVEESGLNCVSMHGLGVYVENKDQLKKAIYYAKVSLKLALTLSPSILVFHSYASRRLEIDKRRKIIRKVFEEIKGQLMEKEISISLENVSSRSKGWGRSVSELSEMLNLINYEEKGITLDFYHSQTTGQTFKFIYELGSYINNVHVCGWEHGPIEKTDKSMREFLKALRNCGYKGPLTIELSPKYGEKEVLVSKGNIEEILSSLTRRSIYRCEHVSRKT